MSSTPSAPTTPSWSLHHSGGGRLPIVTSLSASNVEAKISKAAFLAPEIRISPFKGRASWKSIIYPFFTSATQACACHSSGVKVLIETACTVPLLIRSFISRYTSCCFLTALESGKTLADDRYLDSDNHHLYDNLDNPANLPADAVSDQAPFTMLLGLSYLVMRSVSMQR